LIEAYSPVAHGAALRNPVLADLAARTVSAWRSSASATVCNSGLLPLSKSTSADHMRSNAADFEIDKDDMATLTGLSNAIDYREASTFPVFGKPRQAAGSTKPA
jgi:diketogulonate reductase-like aldo/keto reductase